MSMHPIYHNIILTIRYINIEFHIAVLDVTIMQLNALFCNKKTPTNTISKNKFNFHNTKNTKKNIKVHKNDKYYVYN